MEKTPIDVHIYIMNLKNTLNEYAMYEGITLDAEHAQFTNLFFKFIEQASYLTFQSTGEPELSSECIYSLYEEAIEEFTMQTLQSEGLVERTKNKWQLTQKGIFRQLTFNINYN